MSLTFKKLPYVFLLSVVLVSFGMTASAQEDLSSEDIIKIVQNIADFFIVISEMILAIFIVFYAVQMMTAGGNAAKFQEAKTNLMWALIGALVIFAAYVIIDTIANIVYKKF